MKQKWYEEFGYRFLISMVAGFLIWLPAIFLMEWFRKTPFIATVLLALVISLLTALYLNKVVRKRNAIIARREINFLINGPMPQFVEKVIVAWRDKNVIHPNNVAILEDYIKAINELSIIAEQNVDGIRYTLKRMIENSELGIKKYHRKVVKPDILWVTQYMEDRVTKLKIRVREPLNKN